jgi:CRP-like cAMP-binding protein
VVEAAVSSRIDTLAGLSPEELNRLVAACRVLKIAAGEKVFAEGDQGDELFIVRQGKVRIVKTITPELKRTIAVIEKGGVFGELVIIDAGSRSASAEAVEATEVLGFGRDAFLRLAEERPPLALKLLGRLAASLADSLRVTNELLSGAFAWGLEVSGVANLGLDKILRTNADVRLTLVTGREIPGRLVKVEKTPCGHEITIRGLDDRLHIVPYHAVADMEFAGDLLVAGPAPEVR